MASADDTVWISSASDGLQCGTTKPAPVPSMTCPPLGFPDNTADSDGSTATMRIFGSSSRRRSELPRSEPHVPTLCTNAVIFPFVWAHNSFAIAV